MKIDRSSEKRACRICGCSYDNANNRPECLIPCGHTFCASCIEELTRECSVCGMHYNQVIPDYEMRDICRKINTTSLSDKTTETSEKSGENITTTHLKPEIYHLIMSGTKSQQLIGTTTVRKLLSIERNPPIQEIVDSGLVPKLIELLKSDYQSLAFEAAWALTNIASGSSEQTKVVVNLGATPIFIELIDSKKEDLREQAIWALGNIAGDSSQLRDMTLDLGILNPLIRVVQDKTIKISTLRNSVWCLSNLCRGKPQPNFDLIKPVLPVLNELLDSSDQECLTDTCWALSYISDGPNERIQAVLDSINLPKLVNLLNNPIDTIKTPAIRTIGNIVTGDDVQTQAIVDLGVVKIYDKLLDHPKESIRKEICWSISNITAGSQKQIQAVIDSNIVSKLEILFPTSSFNVRKEISWVYSNALSGGDDKQRLYFLKHGGLTVLIENLKHTDSTLIQQSLEAFEIILPYIYQDDDDNHDSEFIKFLKDAIDQNNVDELFEKLTLHANSKIYDRSSEILEKYFSDSLQD